MFANIPTRRNTAIQSSRSAGRAWLLRPHQPCGHARTGAEPRGPVCHRFAYQYIPTFASLRVAPPGRSSLMELWPQAGVVFDAAGNLYGTTSGDGTSTFGSVFGITP
jgi:hypothetical protein